MSHGKGLNVLKTECGLTFNDLTKTDINEVLKGIMAGKTRISVENEAYAGRVVIRGMNGYGMAACGAKRSLVRLTT